MSLTATSRSADPRVGAYLWRQRTWQSQGAWRRWSGRRWARAAYAPVPERLNDPRDWSTYPELPEASRERLLAKAIDLEVLDGARVVDRSAAGTTLGYQRKVSHVSHGLLTLLTGGVWGFVWVAMCLARKEDRVRYEVDPWGNVWPVSS